ncbi:MAG TPA: HesA/MoeB/ThiF family protein [Candidatus Deferrimicrobium sp.]|nr:HesA/MoeB/ThiF family protein [Candidatus Deferrimicrobium sp.]
MKLNRVNLTDAERERYARQLLIKNWGEGVQKKLKEATVAIIGVGGLGSITSLYATAAGIGKIKIVDNDFVDISNLNRQIIHFTPDIAKKKVDSAYEKLHALNPEINIEPISTRITQDNIKDLIKNCTVVLDCLDNFETRFLLNKTCIELNIPYVHAACYAFEGRVLTIVPGKSPCLQCFYPKIPSEMQKIPVVGAAVGIIASIEVTEAIKLITGIGKPLIGRLLIVDGENMTFDIITVKRHPKCSICGVKL